MAKNPYDASPSYERKIMVKYELKRRTNFVSALGNMFFYIGDSKSCERLYVKYVKIVEANVGQSTLETSSCYFLVGVFYLQDVPPHY